MAYDSTIPYDDLPELPPAMEVESKPVLKQCLAATRALAELKGAGGLIPDQKILINSIPLQEAQMSSEIENIVTTQDELFQAAAMDQSKVTDPATKEVLRYRTALKRGTELLESEALSLNTVLEVCRVLRDRPGLQFRKTGEQVWIGNPRTREAHYTPPSGGPVLLAKLKNLEAFLLDSHGLDPLVCMAIAHYQFEAIHPFDDGNGRTGRILNILHLLHAGLLDIPVLYLSRFMIRDKAIYYRMLRRVTEDGDMQSWVIYMLRGVEETAKWTTGRIKAIAELHRKTVERCRTEIPQVYSRELIDLIFCQPYCRIGFLTEAGIAKRQTASKYLQELESLGILVGEKKGREVVYRHPALLEVLTS